MNMRKTFSATAIVAVMACTAAHAQVLGGNVGGAVNGALGGGLRDTSVVGNGNANGSFGGELDTGPVLKKTRGVADDTTRRARNAGANVRNRTESTVATAHDTSSNVAASAVTGARSAKERVRATEISSATESAVSNSTAIGSITSDVDGSASGNASASRKGLVAEAATDANAATSLAGKEVEAQQEAPATDEVASDRNDKR